MMSTVALRNCKWKECFLSMVLISSLVEASNGIDILRYKIQVITPAVSQKGQSFSAVVGLRVFIFLVSWS